MAAHGVAWMIGGTAGEGLETAGETFARALAAAGHRPTTQRDFPSRIRGGDTTATVRLAPGGHLCPPAAIDVALAFNATVLPRIVRRLGPDGVLLLDEGVEPHGSPAASTQVVPFTDLAKRAGAPRGKNMVALGASTVMLEIDPAPVADSIRHQFARKGGEVVQANLAAFAAGRDAAAGLPRRPAPPPDGTVGRLWISGNEAAALGALAAGCRVAAAYPITPASDILEFLTPRLAGLGGIAVQMEDEMAALQACIGAGFGGVRALTATSGPGLSLMTESVGLAAAAEVPVVVLDCQRPGPSTGMPTKHAQEDLWHMVLGGHGEAVRMVLAPTDVEDAFRTTGEAFRLAHLYRCPAFVALDQQCSLFKQAVGPFDLAAEARRQGVRAEVATAAGSDAWTGSYLPYAGGGEPVAVAVPGDRGGRHYANSTEHGPDGFTNEDPAVRIAMVERRLRRMEHILADAEDPIVVSGSAQPDVALVSWGSTVEACREAAARAEAAGLGVRVVAVRLLWPFPRDQVAAAIGDMPVYVAEANATAQLGRLLRSELPVHGRSRPALRFDGLPLTSDDILTALEVRP